MSASAAPPRTTRWPIVVLVIAAGMAAGLQVGKVPPAIPLLRNDLGLGLVEAGWVASLFNVVGAVLGLVVGMQTDRLGARRVMLVCLAALALGSAIGATAEDGGWMLFSRAVESIGFVGITVTGPRLIVAAARPADHGRALSFWGTYMPAGMALAMFASPAVLAVVGWRGMWSLNALLVTLFAFMMYRRIRPAAWPEGPGRGGGATLTDAKLTLSSTGPWLLGLCFALYTLQWFAIMAWLPTFLIETQGRAPATAALQGAAVVAVNMGGSLIAGWALHRGWPRWRLIAGAYLVMLTTAAAAMSGLAPAAWSFPLVVLFSGLGGMLPGATLAGSAMHAPSPAQVGTTSGLIVQGANIGSLAGPPAMAMLAAAAGWHGTWLLFFVCGGLGLLVAGYLGVVERRLRTAH